MTGGRSSSVTDAICSGTIGAPQWRQLVRPGRLLFWQLGQRAIRYRFSFRCYGNDVSSVRCQVSRWPKRLHVGTLERLHVGTFHVFTPLFLSCSPAPLLLRSSAPPLPCSAAPLLPCSSAPPLPCSPAPRPALHVSSTVHRPSSVGAGPHAHGPSQSNHVRYSALILT